VKQEQLQEFKSLYGHRTDEGLAKRFGIRVSEVKELAARHALGKDKKRFPNCKMPRWKQEEIEELRRLYPDTDNETLARKLGRTRASVVSKAHNLDLKKSPERLEKMGQVNVSRRRDRSFHEQC
jgi:hypothetical protein